MARSTPTLAARVLHRRHGAGAGAGAVAQEAAPRRRRAADQARASSKTTVRASTSCACAAVTKRITVTPKTGTKAAYEIIPADPSREEPFSAKSGSGGATGQSVWNVLNF